MHYITYKSNVLASQSEFLPDWQCCHSSINKLLSLFMSCCSYKQLHTLQGACNNSGLYELVSNSSLPLPRNSSAFMLSACQSWQFSSIVPLSLPISLPPSLLLSLPSPFLLPSLPPLHSCEGEETSVKLWDTAMTRSRSFSLKGIPLLQSPPIIRSLCRSKVTVGYMLSHVNSIQFYAELYE